jgi:hypothetical protein
MKPTAGHLSIDTDIARLMKKRQFLGLHGMALTGGVTLCWFEAPFSQSFP